MEPCSRQKVWLRGSRQTPGEVGGVMGSFIPRPTKACLGTRLGNGSLLLTLTTS